MKSTSSSQEVLFIATDLIAQNADKSHSGGTAACVVAGRLAEADPKLSILVIEGGQDNRGVSSVEHPIFYLENLLPTSTTALFYQGNESKNLAGRAPIVPSGGTLGGGSSINFMLYTRAQRSDFDSWNTPGWSGDEIYPFLKKVWIHAPRTCTYHTLTPP